jgi:hypothetical protein
VSDDIVTRLRRRRLGDYSVLLCEEAADEIQRLRRNTGCARNQRSTQFCAEALDAQREIERLRAERDEARREVCDMEGETAGGALLEARKRGWDCFKDKACGLCDQPSDAVNGHGDCMNCAKDQYGDR